MEAVLIKTDAWGFVNGTKVKPEHMAGDAASRTADDNWMLADAKAKSDIILSISAPELKQVKGCETSREVWIKLQDIYQSCGPARKATLLKQLILQRMRDDEDVREHLQKFFDAVDKLQEMNVDVNADLLAILLLYSLPVNFENFRCATESRDELPTPEVLRIKIIEEYDARKNDVRGENANAMIADKISKYQSHANNHSIHKNQTERSDKQRKNKKLLKYYQCHETCHRTSECKTNPHKMPRLLNSTYFMDR